MRPGIKLPCAARMVRPDGYLWSADCGVIYSWQDSEAPIEPWWPEWLQERVGVDYLDHVDAVVLYGQGSDAEMRQVRKFNRLRNLSVSDSQVTDAGMSCLNGL